MVAFEKLLNPFDFVAFIALTKPCICSVYNVDSNQILHLQELVTCVKSSNHADDYLHSLYW